MGLVRAVQKGEVPKSKVSNAIKKVAKSMKKKEVEKYSYMWRDGGQFSKKNLN